MNTTLRRTFVLTLGFLLCCGCASSQKHTPKGDQASLQGAWTGQDLGPGAETCHMTITGEALKFRATATNEWYEGRMTLHPETTPKQADLFIEKCSVPKYDGQVSKAIYRLEGNTLTIAATEPGKEEGPTSFEPGNEARVLVFHRE